jgi:hypothetical protein
MRTSSDEVHHPGGGQTGIIATADRDTTPIDVGAASSAAEYARPSTKRSTLDYPCSAGPAAAGGYFLVTDAKPDGG